MGKDRLLRGRRGLQARAEGAVEGRVRGGEEGLGRRRLGLGRRGGVGKGLRTPGSVSSSTSCSITWEGGGEEGG